MKKNIFYKYLLKISIYIFLFPIFITGYFLRIYDNFLKKYKIENRTYKMK
ncbi:hypothetical protein [Fusobacterium perfoetens]|nr:hypothetical protein [Fusobacterium perfoetens]